MNTVCDMKERIYGLIQSFSRFFYSACLWISPLIQRRIKLLTNFATEHGNK